MMQPTDSSDVSKAKPASAGSADAGMNRRKLLKLSVGGASALVVTLASRSVFACQSTTPSAFGSINLSRPDVMVPLSGRSPGYWKQSQHFAEWESPYYPTTTSTHQATTFLAAFGVDSFPGKTLLQVLELEGGGNIAVGRAIVAALLNAADHKTDLVLNVDQVKAMWRDFAMNGYYEPTAGVKWYADSPDIPGMIGSGGIIGYLNTTWT